MPKIIVKGDKPGKSSSSTGSLKVLTKPEGFQLVWGLGEFGSHVEVWQGKTSELSKAEMVRQCMDTYFDSPGMAPGSYYLWTRRVSRYGIKGDFDQTPAIAVVTKK